VVTALFAVPDALRFGVDPLRGYGSLFLGLGTGQAFSLAMTAAGLVMLRPLLLVAPVVYPPGIPASWTAANIVEKRAAVAEPAAPEGRLDRRASGG
jgi:hypothetical protein